MKPATRDMMVLVLFAGVMFAANIWGYDLWPPDEPRFAQVAREMMERGDYLAPHVNGRPYKEKPPLLFWAVAVCSVPFGDVSALTARVPSVAAGIVTVLLTYWLAARLFDRRTAFWTAVLLITCNRFFWQARTAQIDMLLTACTTAAFAVFWQWHTTRRAKWLVAFYAALALGVYAKGPPAVVFPMLMLFAFFWGRRDDRRRSHWVLGLVAVSLLIAVWLVPARMAVAGDGVAGGAIGENLYRQTIGRFFLGVSHARPLGYYLTTLPADWLPWTILFPWAAVWVWRNRRGGEPMRFLLSWILPALVFFSLCSGKRALYLLPLFPAMAMLLARSLLALMDGDARRWRFGTALAWGVELVLGAATPAALLLTDYRQAFYDVGWIGSLCLLGFAADTIARACRSDYRTLHIRMAWHMAGVALLVVGIVLPMVNPHKSARAFCEPVRRLAEDGIEFDLYSVGFSREEFVFYSKKHHKPVLVPPLTMPVDLELGERTLPETHDQVQSMIKNDLTSNGVWNGTDVEQMLLEMHPVTAGLYRPVIQAQQKVAEEFLAAALGEKPALVFIKADDWVWIQALCPSANGLSVVKEQRIGRRHVILLTNSAGRQMLGGVKE